jgi:hypothetical protein
MSLFCVVYSATTSKSQPNPKTQNIIGWLLCILFCCFALVVMIQDSFHSQENNSIVWESVSIVYKNICSFGTTFGALCIIFAWYNSPTPYNPIASALTDEQIQKLNDQIVTNQRILDLQSFDFSQQLSEISSIYSNINKITEPVSLDSYFFVRGTNLDLCQRYLSKANDLIDTYTSQSEENTNFINSLYETVVLRQSLYNDILQRYNAMETWKPSVIAKVLDTVFYNQVKDFQMLRVPVCLQDTIIHGPKDPITILRPKNTSVVTSFKGMVQTSRTSGTPNTITLSRVISKSSPLWFGWNSLYPLGLFNLKASQGYLTWVSNNLLNGALIQDTCSYNSSLLESDFQTTNLVKQVTLQDQAGLTVYNSIDLSTIYLYSDPNGVVLMESRGFVPSSATFYYLSSGMLVAESYSTPTFADATLKDTKIAFSLKSKVFYKYEELPKNSSGDAFLENQNFTIYVNNQMNQVGCLSKVSGSPFTLFKTQLSQFTALSLGFPNPANKFANTSYPYQISNSKYNVSNSLVTNNIISVQSLPPYILTPL